MRTIVEIDASEQTQAESSPPLRIPTKGRVAECLARFVGGGKRLAFGLSLESCPQASNNLCMRFKMQILGNWMVAFRCSLLGGTLTNGRQLHMQVILCGAHGKKSRRCPKPPGQLLCNALCKRLMRGADAQAHLQGAYKKSTQNGCRECRENNLLRP